MKWLQPIKILPFVLSMVVILSGDSPERKNKSLALVPPELMIAKINQIATEISVKVWNQDALGSGILIQQQDKNYIVITNQHVLRAGEPPYQIQTPDGEFHQATVIPTQVSSRYDIALLEFTTRGKTYKTVSIGNSSNLQIGEPVFAVGFPYQEPDQKATTPRLFFHEPLTGMAFTRGRIALVLEQALEEGYQIGYTNDVQKGMSGGALLDIRGALVGVNGKHAYPLWEAPDFYEDNSQPCPPLQELITRSSLAIPIEKIIPLTPEINWRSLMISFPSSDDESWSSIVVDSKETNPEKIIAKMQAEAATTKRCQSSSSLEVE